jgi:hypothetical protein
MKKSELKQIIREELEWYRGKLQEQDSAKPVVDPDKAGGIILGAVKTLFNSGAIIGVDPTRANDVASELVKQLTVAIAPYGQQEPPAGDDLDDETSYGEEEDSLDDQSQYDPDIQKQTSDEEPKAKSEPEEEPLFEIAKIAKKLKL